MNLSANNVTRTWEVDQHGAMVYLMRVEIGREVVSARYALAPLTQLYVNPPTVGREIEHRLRRQIMGAIQEALFP